MDPENTAPQGKALVRFFHSLKTRALEEQNDFIEALPKPQKEILNDDLKEIEVLLAAVFRSCRPSIAHHLQVRRAVESGFQAAGVDIDALVIGGDPHVTPLEAVLEENEKVLFVEVSIGESRLLVYHLGYLEADRITTSVPKKIGRAALQAKRTASADPSAMASQGHGNQGLSPFPGTFLHRL